jgi:predicted metalloprotease with PDZ domain
MRKFGICLLVLFTCAFTSAQIKIAVDASDVSRRIVHTHITMPAKPGPMTIVYPKWIPGEHGPTGPIIDVAGLEFSAGGKQLPWQRDLLDMYAFHVTVPDGATEVEVQFDTLGNGEKSGFLLGYASTANLTGISWNQFVMYPAGTKTDEVTVTASLSLPSDWKFSTALPVEKQYGEGGGTSGNHLHDWTNQQIGFRSLSLTQFVDSPVMAGRYFREVDITPPDEPRKHYLELASDSEAGLQVPADWLEAYKNVVRETGALFGARHYNDYHFLVSLHGTDMNGLEHHQSSQDLLPEMGLVSQDIRNVHGYLLTHEMTHSWNGKYRRPAGLATPDYQQPMKGDLLWVYEGLTHHLGYLLATRSGIWTQENYRDELAQVAQNMTYHGGRAWRPLEDTAAAAQLLYFAPAEWDSWRRDVDYYQEGSLIWLEADTIIRQQTHNAKSLDDFCKAFYGGQSGPPELIPYTEDDVVAALNAVAPYDWKGFFQTRIYDVAPKAPLGGITNSGWKLAYEEEPTTLGRSLEIVREQLDMTASVGMLIDEANDDDGRVIDVVNGGPAANAGIAPTFKIIAVNGRKYSALVLRQALNAAKKSKDPLELIAANGDFFKTYKIDYHDGERYAHLVRDESKPDMLTEIAKPKAR